MDDYDGFALADAKIEDTWHWTCPKCDVTNEHLLGSDDFVRCWRCKSTFKLEDDGLALCWWCFDCGGSGMSDVAFGVRCSTCKGSGALVAPHDLAALHIVAYRLNRRMAEWSEAVLPFFNAIGLSLSRAFNNLADAMFDAGFIRKYPLPTKRKNGRLRSRRERRDIQQQRKRKPYGVWPKDHTRLK